MVTHRTYKVGRYTIICQSSFAPTRESLALPVLGAKDRFAWPRAWRWIGLGTAAVWTAAALVISQLIG